MTAQDRVAIAQEVLSRYLEQFKTRWVPVFGDRYAHVAHSDDAENFHRCDRRDFEIELTNLVQAAFTAAQAPFLAELDVYRQNVTALRWPADLRSTEPRSLDVFYPNGPLAKPIVK